ncbi:FG-GAP-like repeat-containing protein [Streptomyces sp. NBC_00184]|uniref:FG-GAP-like repeat-containing protein n=1 Tax=Streptomyces sp. NBC_00184 TaxID=2975673 RepID=UPI002E2BE1FE|nr:FG-GAP-like repeat-containing protein [Streptomyces sp. NBC_00184]
MTFAADRYVPRTTIPYGAGTSGVLYRQEGHDGLLWTSWDGVTKDVTVPDPSPVTTQAAAYTLANPKWLPAGSDTMITSVGGELRGTDLAGGVTASFVLPTGHAAVTWAGRHVVTRTGTSGAYQFHLAAWEGGEAAAVRTSIGLPAGAEITAAAAADDSTLVVRYRGANGVTGLGLVDFATGGFTDVPAAAGATVKQVVLTADRLAWLGGDVSWVPRADPAARPAMIDLKPMYGELPVIGAVGSSLVVAWYTPAGFQGDSADQSGLRLHALPFTGGEPVTLVRHASSVMAPAPDGSLVVAAGADAGQWALRKVRPGALTTSVVTPVAPVAARVARLSLANGVMGTKETDSMFLPSVFGRTVTTTAGGLAVGGPVYKQWAFSDSEGPWSSGDGHLIGTDGGGDETEVGALAETDDPRWFRMNSGQGSVVDLTGRYVILNGVNPNLQWIGDLGAYDTDPLSRPIRAASVWGTKLWSATTTAGVLTAQDLKTLKITTTIRTGAPCVAKELQAVGRWIYWSCGPTGQAGVWDQTAGKNITVPQGEALIGDGYLVQHDKAAGKLRLTAFRDGTANDTHDIGDLPGSAENKRGVTWTIDKFGGPVAYLGADQRMHLVPSGVAKQPVVPIESEVSAAAVGVGGAPWKARWLMSRPVASWQIVIRNKATGKVVRTLSGSPNAGGGSVATSWNGRTDTGGYSPNGAYTWTLSAKPADGDGTAASASGTLRVTGGAAVPRDFVKRDGVGDLLAFTSAGVADFRAGTGTGLVDAKVSGSGWTGASSVTAAVPFGDVSGDRCNDVLVRVKSGELRAYKPSCGGALKPTTPFTKVGSGWNIYDVLTSPGDLTGDGRSDVIARETSTGYLYLYESTGAGAFKARVKIGTGWKGYLLAGAGDLNGDGKGDLLARDTAGVLWRYAGTGKGTLAARVKVGSGWQVYNALVGVGDVSGDGKDDLLARDTAGVLWSYRGDGRGLFATRVKVGGGWQTYSKLY